MSSQTRSLLIIGALVIGLVIVYGSRLAPRLLGGDHPPDDVLTYTTDLDYWQKTDRETEVAANARFDLDADLNDVPFVLGDWQGEDVEQTNEEVMILLDPEQYVQRFYEDGKGHYLWLSMIGGRSSKPFHAPDICYDADGWTYDFGSSPIPLDGGGEIYSLWMQAEKLFPGQSIPAEHIVSYFYLFPNRQRDLQDGIVLFKLTSGNFGSVEETLEIQKDFVTQLFTKAYTTD